jgi:hypothetical protein
MRWQNLAPPAALATLATLATLAIAATETRP